MQQILYFDFALKAFLYFTHLCFVEFVMLFVDMNFLPTILSNGRVYSMLVVRRRQSVLLSRIYCG